MKETIRVGILDYGTGNIASLYKSLRSAGGKPYLITSKEELKEVKSLILPGVGHFGEAIKSLKKKKMINNLNNIINSGIPVLGICLGFQLLTITSEESQSEKGLGIFPMKTLRIRPSNKKKYKVPHIGWNNIEKTKSKLQLLKNIDYRKQLFYFSNGFGVQSTNKSSYLQAHYYHDSKWTAIAEYKNIFGVQFHPEKSREQGIILLNNFISLSSKYL